MNAPRRARALRMDSLESLDDRVMPSVTVPAPPAPIHPVPVPPAFPSGTPLDKVGQTLKIVYQEYLDYQKLGGHGPFVSSQANWVQINGTTVGIEIRVKGDVNLAVSGLRAKGLQVGGVNAANRIVSGVLPISQLAIVADDANIVGVSPISRPIPRGLGLGRGPR